jgi:cell wall-associated NlpC family hydrolase
MNPFNKILFLFFCLLFASPCLIADDSAPTQSDTIEYVVANANVCPVREKPAHAAEQTTQLLFAEVCEVVEHRRGWTKIRSTIDGQVGWVTSSMLTPTSSSITNSPSSTVVVTPMATATPINGGDPLLLTMGTRLPNYAHGTFEVLGQQYRIDPTCVRQEAKGNEAMRRETVCAIAQTLLNPPYLWGGKNAMGLDCSGFTQVVYAAIGVNILRNAREQITQGEQVNSLADALPGDLAFFGYTDRNTQAIKITHVGLLLSPTEIIHCAGGRVHVDRIDTQGIYLPDGTMTHHLIQIRRYL